MIAAKSKSSPRFAEVRRLIKSSSVTRVIDLIGDRSILRVLQEVFAGSHRFESLQKNIGIARNTLANRLLELVDHRILQRVEYQDNPPRSEYHLTERGRELYGVMLHIDTWERRWSGDMAGPPLIHTLCGQRLEAGLACGKCGKPISAHDMTYLDSPSSGHGVAQRIHKRRARGLHPSDGTSLNVADVLGDWWSALVLSLTFFGVRRFKDMQETVGIAPNILSSRLAHLTACGILGRRAYQETPPRYEYRLTEKGLDFYRQNIAMMIWGDRWLGTKKGFASLILKHKACGNIIVPRTVCRACGKEIKLGDIRTESGIPWAAP